MIKVISSVFKLPFLSCYLVYDFLIYLYLKLYKNFYGYGIHLFVGAFGAGKTSVMCKGAFELCERYKDVTILTNLKLTNFPSHTRIIQFKNIYDIINAPPDTIVLWDEIGTEVNSRDFMSGKKSLPKSVFQHLCQCRKRNMMIYATVQRFSHLDKQIRDITADVTECNGYMSHPFTRYFVTDTYSLSDYELYQSNLLYKPEPISSTVYVQSSMNRCLYDTSELIKSMLEKDYISDDEILKNRGDVNATFVALSKNEQKRVRRNRF